VSGFGSAVDLSAFAQRHSVVTADAPDEMSEKLSTLYAPYDIVPLDKTASYHARLASTAVRSIRLGTLTTRVASVGRAMADSDHYSLTFVLKGETHTWRAGMREEITAALHQGRLYQRRTGTVTIDGEGTSVINMWVPRALLQTALQQLLGDEVERPIEFQPRVDAASGAGATLFRSMLMATSELSDPHSSFSHPAVAVRFEEFIAHTMLHGLPHSHRDLLTAQRSAAAPRSVVRALDFIKSHAGEPLTIADIASAAGCSVRALQLAFRAWRDTTPMKELNRVRLEYAHAALLKMGLDCTVTQIAMKWGFGHPGRFAQQYAQVIGQSPSQTQRYGLQTARPGRIRGLQSHEVH
jgi:AraC-like DNA-binding protein